MEIQSINIDKETWGENEGKYRCKISFKVNEDVNVYAKADEITTAELIKVLIPVFEKITNQKFEDVVSETEKFLNKFNFKKKDRK